MKVLNRGLIVFYKLPEGHRIMFNSPCQTRGLFIKEILQLFPVKGSRDRRFGFRGMCNNQDPPARHFLFLKLTVKRLDALAYLP